MSKNDYVSIANEFDTKKPKELAKILENGYSINPHDIENVEYKGISLGIPKIVEKLFWKTFKKVFYRNEGGALVGWNIKIEQTGLDGEFQYKKKKDQIQAWGHYQVISNQDKKCPLPCKQALLIDYGLAGNSNLGMTSKLRDPIVALHQGSSEILLGWSYLQLAGLQFSTSSYFLLVKDKPLSHIALPNGMIKDLL